MSENCRNEDFFKLELPEEDYKVIVSDGWEYRGVVERLLDEGGYAPDEVVARMRRIDPGAARFWQDRFTNTLPGW